jgi:hypothetical protein
MKFVLYLPAVLLAGCAVSGSWLDRVGVPPHPPVAMSDEQASALRGEARDLRTREEAIRVALATEKDRKQRLRHYEELRRIGDQVVPIERQLLDAGRAPRSAPSA